MVAQLALPIEIVECAIIRGEDGLALSSRNTLLDAAHRAAAPHIYATLHAAVSKSQEMTPAEGSGENTAENTNMETPADTPEETAAAAE